MSSVSRSKYYDEYGFELKKDLLNEFAIHCANNEESESMRLTRYKDCLFSTERTYKDRVYSQMVRTGIPRSARRSEWLECSGVMFVIQENEGYYEKKLAEVNRDEGVNRLVSKSDREEIGKDVGRTGHNMIIDQKVFGTKIRDIALVFCAEFPQDGYTQGLNFIISNLLILNFTEEETFWMLRYICRDLFPLTFSPGLVGANADIALLAYYMSFKCKDFLGILSRFNIEVRYFLDKLVCSLGSRILPQESCYCIWDRMICGGAIEFFKSILRIFNHLSQRFFSSLGLKIDTIDMCTVIHFFDSVLTSLVDITNVLITRIPGRQIEHMCFNKRRNNYRRLEYQKRPRRRERTSTLTLVPPLSLEPTAMAENKTSSSSPPSPTSALLGAPHSSAMISSSSRHPGYTTEGSPSLSRCSSTTRSKIDMSVATASSDGEQDNVDSSGAESVFISVTRNPFGETSAS